MQITDILAQLGGFQSVAKELGVSEAQAASGAEALIPAILGGFKKQVKSQPSGIEGLGGMLGKFGGSSLLDDVLGPQPTNVNLGNDVLGQLFGSKDVSRAVAQDAAAKSGLSPDLLKKMLPMLAMLVSGYMAKKMQTGTTQPSQPGGVLSSLLSRLRVRHAAGSATQGGAMMGLASMLDLDSDGNPLDDIMQMAGKAKSEAPTHEEVVL